MPHILEPYIQQKRITTIMDFQSAVDKVLEFAKKRYRQDFILDKEQQIIERETLWFIPFIEKKQEERKLWLGATKGAIIDKETGEILQPGSVFSVENWVLRFELGFRHKLLDFTITKINDEKRTIEILKKIEISYVIPKLENGQISKTPLSYNSNQLKERISNLPCTFKNQSFNFKHLVIQEMKESKAFEYKINPNYYEYEGIYGELIDINNLIK